MNNNDKFDCETGKPLQFYCLDVVETLKRQGIYLFGKVLKDNTYVSACILIENIYRKIYLLPRKHHMNDPSKLNNFNDVCEEFELKFGKQLKLNKTDYNLKKVIKNNVFYAEVSNETEYLEVSYLAKEKLPLPTQFGNTFSKIFETDISNVESFLLSKSITLPCWLLIKKFELMKNPTTWCRVEYTCSISNMNIDKINKTIPPLNAIAVNIHVKKNILQQAEIVMISCSVNENILNEDITSTEKEKYFCGFAITDNIPHDLYYSLVENSHLHVQKFNSETSLLNYFINQFKNIDPDLILGFDLDINILFSRISLLCLTNLPALGKLKTNKSKHYKDLFKGRLFCDINPLIQELKLSKHHDLNSLCRSVLNIAEDELKRENFMQLQFDTSTNIINMACKSLKDARNIVNITQRLNIIPIAMKITNTCGNLLTKTLLGGQSDRIDFLLLHAFYNNNYILPEKCTKEKESYQGALVLEPKIGFYDRFVALMDFNSMYPNIIREYNICHTTFNQNNCNASIKGILPEVTEKLVKLRNELKRLLKNPYLPEDLRTKYKIEEYSLKLISNSVYGCLGCPWSRFYHSKLAALITSIGRNLLTSTKELVEDMNYEVIYGDTDSIMIKSNSECYDEVLNIVFEIKRIVNSKYKYIELDVDSIFKYLLILKKKKYAAVKITKSETGNFITKNEYKGIDIVRKDLCPLARKAGENVLDIIFMDLDFEDKLALIYGYVANLTDDIINDKLPLTDYIIKAQLNKEPQEYSNSEHLPHIYIAKQNNIIEGLKPYRKGDLVSYIICNDDSIKTANQRAYDYRTIENLKRKFVKVDKQYYIEHQIYPIVKNLCEPICKIEASFFENSMAHKQIVKKTNSSFKECYKEIRNQKLKFELNAVLPFEFICIQCKWKNIVDGPVKNSVQCLSKCCNDKCNAKPIDYINNIINQLYIHIRNAIKKFYNSEYVCKNKECKWMTRHLFIDDYNSEDMKIRCKKCNIDVMELSYGQKDLYNQLLKFHSIFDLDSLEFTSTVDKDTERGFRSLANVAAKYLNQNGYARAICIGPFEIFEI